jgi:LCP family protein required for cell wall assembly
VLALAFCGLILHKALFKPPEPAPPRSSPSAAGGEGGFSGLGASASSESGGAQAASGVTPKPASGRREGLYTFLLVGFDQGQGNTDTIMIGRLDSKNHKLNIVSIPRDTCANVYYGYVSTKKINAVYTLGGGIDALMEAVSNMAGFNIDSYMVVNLKAFTALVDALGGVDFDIPYDMGYDDPTQNLHIHFPKGLRHLTGAEAAKVVRWRQNNNGANYGDIERINIQHAFLKTVARQCLSLSNLVTKLDDYIEIFRTYVKTDLTAGNLAWYGGELLKLSEEDICFDTLPSNYCDSIRGFSYGTIYVDEWVEMVNEKLNPNYEAVTAGNREKLTRAAAGRLTATGGEIAGGYASFLDYDEYLAGLTKPEAEAGAASGGAAPQSSPEESAAPETAPGGGAAGEPEAASDGAARDLGEAPSEEPGLFYSGTEAEAGAPAGEDAPG